MKVMKQKQDKKLFIVGILIVLALLNVSGVLALGVSPGKNTLSYDDNLNQDFSFTVINSEAKAMKVLFEVSGDLNDSIYLHEDYALFAPSDEKKNFTYSLIVNDVKGLHPGENIGEILIREVAPDEEIAAFTAMPAVSMQVVINAPYPNKYIESVVEILESDKNETTTFLIPLINRGEEEVETVKAEIDISKKGNPIDSLESETISIESMERTELSIDWLANVPLGVYEAEIRLVYDDEIATYYKNFKVGDIDVDVFDIFVEDFELGNIVAMEILVDNKWSEELEAVYAQMVLYDRDSNKIVDIKSAPYDIPALSKIRIPLHWDTAGVEKGEYIGWIKMIGKDYESKKDLRITISKDGIGLELESGGFVFGEETSYLWIWIILILIVGIVAIVVILRNFPRK